MAGRTPCETTAIPERASAAATAALALLAAGAAGQEGAVERRSGPHRAPPPKIELSGGEVSLPMKTFGNRPVVEATLDGKGPYPFVLDTGASGTVVSESFARSLGMPVIGKARVQSPGAPTAAERDLLRIERLEFGGAKISDLIAVADDLSGPFPGPKDPVGVLSAGMFAGHLVTFDYPAARISIRPGELPPGNGQDVFEFDAARRIPELPVVFGSLALELDLDTGSPYGLTIPAEAAARLSFPGGLAAARPDRRIDRVLEAKEGRLAGSATIGRFAFENPTIRVVEGISRGVLGYEVLRRFSVTVDSKNRRVRLEEPPKAARPAHG